MKIEAGDSIIHKPTGETWFCLGVNRDRDQVCAGGWPPTMAKLSDCELVEKGKGLKESEVVYRNSHFGIDWERYVEGE